MEKTKREHNSQQQGNKKISLANISKPQSRKYAAWKTKLSFISKMKRKKINKLPKSEKSFQIKSAKIRTFTKKSKGKNKQVKHLLFKQKMFINSKKVSKKNIYG